MAETVVIFREKQYIWTGEDWYEAGSYLLPPASIVSQLN